jgi:hypothetical protein
MALTKDDLNQIVMVINGAVDTLLKRMDKLEDRMDRIEDRMDEQVFLDDKRHQEQMRLLGQYVNEVIDLKDNHKKLEKRVTRLELFAA